MAKTDEIIVEEIIQDTPATISIIQTGTKVWNEDKEAFIHDNEADKERFKGALEG